MTGERNGQTLAAAPLASWLGDARQRTLDLITDLRDEQLITPHLPTVNPLLWEVGHVAWFHETWVLRHACGRGPLDADSDRLYDSSAVPHATRWDLAIPGPHATLEYLRRVHEAVLDV